METPEPTKDWETLDGIVPDRVLDRHPDGRLVALQISSAPLNRAAIWDAGSGRLVWAPADTIALCWMPGGHQIILLRESYTRDAHHPSQVASPLQSEYMYRLERRAWLGGDLISGCQLQPPAGWLDGLTVSPRGDLAAVRWVEQDCAGFFLVALDAAAGDWQLPNASYRTSPNLIAGPVFSPDGGYLALSCTRSLWWVHEQEDPSTPARGGRYDIGHVTVYDVAELCWRELRVVAEVPADWLPSDLDDQETELLGEPRFLSDSEFAITLPTGAEQRFRVG